MTKKVSKISAKEPNKKEKKLKVIICVLVCLLIGALTAGCFLMRGSIVSREEKRRLEAFESLAYSYIDNGDFLGNNKSHTRAEATGIGISEDGDLYLSFRIFYYDNSHDEYVANEYQDGKLYFQCDKEYRKPVTNKDSAHCAFAYSYEDKKTIEK